MVNDFALYHKNSCKSFYFKYFLSDIMDVVVLMLYQNDSKLKKQK